MPVLKQPPLHWTTSLRLRKHYLPIWKSFPAWKQVLWPKFKKYREKIQFTIHCYLGRILGGYIFGVGIRSKRLLIRCSLTLHPAFQPSRRCWLCTHASYMCVCTIQVHLISIHTHLQIHCVAYTPIYIDICVHVYIYSILYICIYILHTDISNLVFISAVVAMSLSSSPCPLVLRRLALMAFTISSYFAGFDRRQVRSTTETSGVGTRKAILRRRGWGASGICRSRIGLGSGNLEVIIWIGWGLVLSHSYIHIYIIRWVGL